jgi:hypothetical protein
VISILSNRKQYVKINYRGNTTWSSETFTSIVKEVKNGVPQGLVLGPILFLLYINDLQINISEEKTVLFADDAGIQIEAGNADVLNQKIKVVMQQL